nr:MAG TPA: hypothetical protein [Caudoviricetes sp.]
MKKTGKKLWESFKRICSTLKEIFLLLISFILGTTLITVIAFILVAITTLPIVVILAGIYFMVH